MRVLEMPACPIPTSIAHAVSERFTVLLGGAEELRTRTIDRLDPARDLNFDHFRARHMVAELLRTGLPPGGEAPDFELPSTDGHPVRLSDLRGRPVVLHFVSYTCPVTRGGVYTMRELRRLYGEQVQFVEVLVRQAHPGELHGAYRSYQDKLGDACLLELEEHLPGPVLIDDLAGTVQRGYGGLAAAVYLIDSRGTIVFCGTWGQSPALRHAIDELLAGDDHPSSAARALDRRPHLAAAIVAGQRGPIRGGRQSLIDLELGFPGAMALMLIGRAARPVLAPLALRTTPVPNPVRAALLAVLVVAGIAVGVRARLRSTGRSWSS